MSQIKGALFWVLSIVLVSLWGGVNQETQAQTTPPAKESNSESDTESDSSSDSPSTKQASPVEILKEVKALTVLPKDSEGWDRWDDWSLYSRDSQAGLSFGLAPGLGFFGIASRSNGTGTPAGSGEKFMIHLPGRLFYGHPALPWLQASLTVATGIATFSTSGERNFIVPLMSGIGFEIHFVRFPPLAPLFLGFGMPFGGAYISGGSKEWYFSYGWEMTVGIELAISSSQSVGFRMAFSRETVNQSLVGRFERLQVGFEYRSYFNLKLFNGS